MLSGQSLIDNLWKLRLYKIYDSPYDSIVLENIVYPYWVVSFILEGRVEVTDGNESAVACPGQVMIHAPNVPFSECADRPGRHLWFLADIRSSYDAEMFRLFPVCEVVTLAEPDKYTEIFMQLLEACHKEQSQFGELQTAALGLHLLYLILDGWEKGGRIPRKQNGKRMDARVDQVYVYLSSRLDEKITRETLADLVHLNPNYLDKIFYDKYRIKPIQLLREMRLKKVKRMLEAGDEPLSSIAAACGLGDAPYLSHQFFKRYGISPGAYREQVRRTQPNYYKQTALSEN